MKKNARHTKILELIEKYEIDTQQTLTDKLLEEGFSVTQTTVSRDIRALKLIKGMTKRGTYKYVLPQTKRDNATPTGQSAIYDSVLSVVSAQNLVVVRTLSGMANAMAVCIDSIDHENSLGSIAGDDTILIITQSNETATILAEELKTLFGKK